MDIAKLEVLNLEIPLAKHEKYHDDGFVVDTFFYRNELNERYFGVVDATPNERPPHGETFVVYRGDKKFIHIYYENTNDPLKNIHTRAHEEVHALLNLKRGKNYLKEKLKNFGFKINLERLDKEGIAEIGSLCAMLEKDYPIEEIMREFGGFCYFLNKNLNRAKKVSSILKTINKFY